MLKPPPSATIPGVTDTLDFVKNLWGSMNIPGASLPGMSGMSAPALSTEDLDKRIADMKAVESWLNLNLTMLRGTIQTMEVQRGTLATLKSMGASMAEAMRQSGVSAEKLAAMPFGPFFGQPAQGAGSASPSAKPAAAGGGSAQPGTGAPGGSAPGALPGADAGAAMGMPAAMAWWNMLQEQFTQAVTTAMTPSPAAATGASDGKDADQPAAPQTHAPSAPTPDSALPENGNGKARGGKPKTDKG
jgi:hypothetical protein